MTDSAAAVLKDILGMVGQLDARVTELQQINAGMIAMLTVGIRSAFESHPNPYQLKEAWDRQLADMWSQSVPVMQPDAKYTQGMKQVQDMLQGALER